MSIEGKTFCISGGFGDVDASEIAFGLTDHGGKESKNVTKSVDVFIAGRNPGKRLDEAVALGIPVLYEKHLDGLFDGKSIEELLAEG